MWSLGKQLLIQLYLLIALLFWAFSNIFLGFAWTFSWIKIKGCCISPWFMASKRSKGTGSVHAPSTCARGCHVQVKHTKNAASACGIGSAFPPPTKSNHTAAAGTVGMGKLLLQRMGRDVLCLEKRGSGQKYSVMASGVGSGLRVPFWHLWGGFFFSACCGDPPAFSMLFPTFWFFVLEMALCQILSDESCTLFCAVKIPSLSLRKILSFYQMCPARSLGLCYVFGTQGSQNMLLHPHHLSWAIALLLVLYMSQSLFVPWC